MGVLTSVHRVPVGVLKKFQKEPRLIGFLIYDDAVRAEALGMPAGWTAQKYRFDKEWEDLAGILRQVGHRTAGSLLEDGATALPEPSGSWCRYWRKTKLKRIYSDLRHTTQASLTERAMGVEDLTDWNGNPAHNMLDYYLQGFDELKAIILEAIEAGDALVAVSS
jgi:hypothetical protein